MADEPTTWVKFVSRTTPDLFMWVRRADNGDVEWTTGREDDGASGVMHGPELRAFWRRADLDELKWQGVNSSNIASVGYCPIAWQLRVRFKDTPAAPSRRVYLYDNVPPAVAAPLLNPAPYFSVGRYFAAEIKPFPDRYPFTYLDEAR